LQNPSEVISSLIHALSPVTLPDAVKKKWLTEENWGRYILLGLGQIILFTVQIPLLVMAIRRGFKR
jgi:hypothetical protein